MDLLQLTAQAMCLEEMLCCEIPFGYLYYGEIRRRERVDFSADIRKEVEEMFREMHSYFGQALYPQSKMEQKLQCLFPERHLPAGSWEKEIGEGLRGCASAGGIRVKRLLNTLYVTSPNRYLSLDGENVVISEKNEEVGRVPLHNLEMIVTFGYTGASPALMGACAGRNIGLVFLSGNGRFIARVVGEAYGNVTLRKEQYRRSEQKEESLAIARNCILGKVYNSRWILERAARDYAMRLDVEKLRNKSGFLASSLTKIRNCRSAGELLGLEGEAASVYFSVFDDLILQQKEDFHFSGRESETADRRSKCHAVLCLYAFNIHVRQRA